MAIPEAQLKAWSERGGAGQPAETLAAISRALAGMDYKRYGRPEVYLQGSHALETDTSATQAVDIVIFFRNVFLSDVSGLNAHDLEVYEGERRDSKFSDSDVKAHIVDVLGKELGKSEVTLGEKAIHVAGADGRGAANVVAACGHLYFYTFPSRQSARFVEGIVFGDKNKRDVVGYPKQHLANGETKHKSCAGFKPVVRVFKQLAGHLVEQGLLPAGHAPSYFIECFVYNAPVTAFHSTLESSVLSLLIHWDATRAKWDSLLHQHQVGKLFGPAGTQWNAAHAEQFMNACRTAWDDWDK